jgi:hypothetical protein
MRSGCHIKRRAAVSTALLYTSSFEEPGDGCVLLDVGGIALLGGIHFALCLRRVLADFGSVAGALAASIRGWHGRHFIVTRHLWSLAGGLGQGVQGVLVPKAESLSNNCGNFSTAGVLTIITEPFSAVIGDRECCAPA